jgi:TetR/AcrR family transcriptional regulator, transcriptional repressor for nem operon
MEQTRYEIIELADSIIRNKGYNAFSYSNISGVMDIRNASVHHYFPAKSDLGERVIHDELLRIAKQQKECIGLTGEEQLRKILETFFKRSRKGLMCLTGAFTPEFATLPDELQGSVRKMCEVIFDSMSTCLEKSRREGSLYFQGESSDRALLVMSTLFSSLIMSRVMGGEIFDRMIDQLLKDLGSNIRIAQFVEDIPEHLL